MAVGGYKFLDKLSGSEARQLYEQGALLVLLNLPPKSVFGIDTNSWEVGDKFKGVKMIPPGVHFIHCQSVSRDGCTGPVIGFFHVFKSKEMVVKEWDQKMEMFSVKETNADELAAIEGNIHLYEPCLAPFPFDDLKTWISLSCHITHFSLVQLGINDCTLSVINPDGLVKFSSIPSPITPKGASPNEITKAHMDQTSTLNACIISNYQGDSRSLLGELQSSFLLFLYGHIYEGFEQWRRLLELFCSCDQALLTHSELFSQFISVLHFQLNVIPMDFFLLGDQSTETAGAVGGSNIFLISKLNNLFLNLNESPGNCEGLKSRADRFKSMLIHKFKWNFECPEEDLPVVVPM